MKGFLGHSFRQTGKGVQTKCTIPQDGSHSSSSGCGKTPAEGSDASGYVLVAVVSFAAAAAITALCFRLRSKENQKKGGTGKPDPQKQERKTT